MTTKKNRNIKRTYLAWVFKLVWTFNNNQDYWQCLQAFIILHLYLFSMVDTICWRVSTDCLVLLLIIGPCIWAVLGFSSNSYLSFVLLKDGGVIFCPNLGFDLIFMPPLSYLLIFEVFHLIQNNTYNIFILIVCWFVQYFKLFFTSSSTFPLFLEGHS